MGEMVAQGAAIQESVGNLDAPQGFWNPNLKATEEDMAKMVGDVPWPTAYQTYQDVVQSVKASEQAIVQLKLDKHNLIQKRDRTLQMGVAWKCFSPRRTRVHHPPGASSSLGSARPSVQ